MSSSSLVCMVALVAFTGLSSSAQSQRNRVPESFTATAQFIGAAGSAATTLTIPASTATHRTPNVRRWFRL